MALPNDSVEITPGTGAVIATHVVGTREYQVVMLADVAGHLYGTLDTWYAWAQSTFAGGRNHITLFNGVGSGRVVRVRRLHAVNLQTSAVTGVQVLFNVERVTGVSGGTPVTPVPADTTNAALPAQVTVVSGGSVTGATLLSAFVTNNDEVGATTTASAGAEVLRSTNLVPTDIAMQPLTLRPGQGLNVNQVTATTVGLFGWHIVFTVE